jgi:hypothetical protein
VLRTPARPEELVAAEANLDVRLPDSYRRFLELTDGAYADWDQPMAELSGPRLGSTDPWVGLLPVGEIVRLADALPHVVEMWTGPDWPSEPEPAAQRDNATQVRVPQALADALLITSHQGGMFLLCLVPVDLRYDAGGEGWELWDKGHSEICRYLTFGDWLLERRPAGWLTAPNALRFGVDHMRQWLDRGDPDNAATQCNALRTLRLAPTTHELTQYLRDRSDRSDGNPYVLLAAAQALQAHDPAGGVARLEGMTRHDEPSIRVAATATLRLLRRDGFS